METDNFFSDLIKSPHFFKTKVEIEELPENDDEIGRAILSATGKMFFFLVFMPNGINHFEDLTNVICGDEEDNAFKKALRLLSHAVNYQEEKNTSLESIIVYLQGKGIEINIPKHLLPKAISNLKTNIKNYEIDYRTIIESSPAQKYQWVAEHQNRG